MEESANIRVRQLVRKDLLQNGRVLFVPEGMTDGEIEEAYGEALKKGLINKVVKAPVGSGGGRAARPGDEGGAAARAAAASERIWSPAPASAELQLVSVGAATPGRCISAGRSGPCLINHVNIFTISDGGALNVPLKIGLNIATSKDVPAYGGEITVFEYFDSQGSFGVGEGNGEILYKQRVDTAVGSRTWPQWDFYPHIVIPFSTFYVVGSIGPLNHPAIAFVTVDFAPIEAPRARISGTVSVTPREVQTAPVAAPVAVPPHIETRTFFGYAAIKTAESLGFKPVWSTIHAVAGQPGWYSIQGAVK